MIFIRNEFKLGTTYSRYGLSEILNIEEEFTNRRSQLFTGIYEYHNFNKNKDYCKSLILFVTLEKNDPDYQYNDYFENHYFHWDSQNRQSLNSDQINKIIENSYDEILLFVRQKDKIASQTQEFIYCGRLEYFEHDINSSNPVHIIFESLDYFKNIPSYEQIILNSIHNWKPPEYDENYSFKNNHISVVDQNILESNHPAYAKDKKHRKTIENYAMNKAMTYYKNQGFTVQDKSSTCSYDLLCENDNSQIKVEVKGTTTKGNKVIITPNEYKAAIDPEFCRCNPETEYLGYYEKCTDSSKNISSSLYVVYSIKIEKKSNDYIAKGGGNIHIPFWKPNNNDLIATQYEYSLPFKNNTVKQLRDPYWNEEIKIKINDAENKNILTERQANVLKLRYGIEDGRSRSIGEIAKDFGVSMERIIQIETKALNIINYKPK